MHPPAIAYESSPAPKRTSVSIATRLRRPSRIEQALGRAAASAAFAHRSLARVSAFVHFCEPNIRFDLRTIIWRKPMRKILCAPERWRSSSACPDCQRVRRKYTHRVVQSSTRPMSAAADLQPDAGGSVFKQLRKTARDRVDDRSEVRAAQSVRTVGRSIHHGRVYRRRPRRLSTSTRRATSRERATRSSAFIRLPDRSRYWSQPIRKRCSAVMR